MVTLKGVLKKVSSARTEPGEVLLTITLEVENPNKDEVAVLTLLQRDPQEVEVQIRAQPMAPLGLADLPPERRAAGPQ